MAGTTTNFAIPYPSSSDYVTDGATAMRSIADQVDAVLFTGSSSGNLLINGAMQISQRSAVGTAVTGITTDGYYTADRWNAILNTLGTWSQTTIADAPTGSGFRNSLKMACTTADASPAAVDYCIVRQKIEGQNLQAIRKGTASAQAITLSFWVKSFQTGTFICELEDSDNLRSCSKSYTINASNTWEYKTITYPADVTGVLNNDADTSLTLYWWLGAGSTFTSGTLNTTWGTQVNANRAVGQTNVASSTSNNWFMTGAQLTVGSVATPFEFKSFADDLRACQRYYWRITASTANRLPFYSNRVSSTQTYGTINHPMTMRTVPTVIDFNNAGVTDSVSFTSTSGTWAFDSTLSNAYASAILLFSSSGVNDSGNALSLLASGSYFGIGAEL